MRIIKYLFLLLLLSLVALSIFIATQKGEFTIERSKIINSPKTLVYNYVNDYRNWEDFETWSDQDTQTQYNYPENTIGKGASYNWVGKNGSGNIQTIFTKENDSIAQKMTNDGTNSEVNWKFKDTVGGTKVTWRSKGKMDFMFKIYSALNGGVDKIIGTIYEKSLVNLDKNLVYEIKTFSIKSEGLVTQPQLFYVAQTFTTEISKINKNFKIVLPKITTFCADNNITVTGSPFIIYHTYDTASGLAKISIALAIQSEISLSAGSDINSGKLENFEAVKVTLTGDYSHSLKAYNKAIAVLNQKQLKRDPNYAFIAIYKKGKSEVKNPSKWITEIYIPLPPKVQAVTNELPSSQSTNEVVIPESLPAKTPEPAKAKKKVEIKKPTAPTAIEEEFEF